MSDKKPTLVVITGPTASGKSALAVQVAHLLNTEVISADSRQVYRDIPISTAQPSAEEMDGIRHHLMGHLRLDDYWSASMFEQQALSIARSLMARTGYAVVCGGSMMYVDALCHGVDELPTVPDAIRSSLAAQWAASGDDWLRMRLLSVDEEFYRKVDLKNMKRVFHAVEISLAAGRPYSSMITGEKQSREFNIVKVFLEAPREILFDRINRRVLTMIDNGLEEEAHGVYQLRELNSLNTVGLKEMFEYFDGKMTKEEAIARIQKNTRVYARKQMTWFRNDSTLLRLDLRDSGNAMTIKKKA